MSQPANAITGPKIKRACENALAEWLVDPRIPGTITFPLIKERSFGWIFEENVLVQAPCCGEVPYDRRDLYLKGQQMMEEGPRTSLPVLFEAVLSPEHTRRLETLNHSNLADIFVNVLKKPDIISWIFLKMSRNPDLPARWRKALANIEFCDDGPSDSYDKLKLLLGVLFYELDPEAYGRAMTGIYGRLTLFLLDAFKSLLDEHDIQTSKANEQKDQDIFSEHKGISVHVKDEQNNIIHIGHGSGNRKGDPIEID